MSRLRRSGEGRSEDGERERQENGRQENVRQENGRQENGKINLPNASPIFLSAIFLSYIFLSAIFLSAIFLSESLFFHCGGYDAESIDQAARFRRVLITEGGAARPDFSESPTTAAQSTESLITLFFP